MAGKILIADDSVSDRKIIEQLLSDYTILTACDGTQALQTMQEDEAIDLLILSMNMPNEAAFEILQALKANPRPKQLRTLILTNAEKNDDEIRGLKLGAVDFIRKPIQSNVLRAKLKVQFALLEAQRALEQQHTEQSITLEKIFKQVPVGIAISFSKDGTPAESNQYFNINPAFETITGRTQDELKQLGWAAITHPDDVEENLQYYERFQAGEIDEYALDKRYIRPDGSFIWVHMVCVRLALNENHPFNHISLVEDITDSKQTQAELKESERSKAVLLSNLQGMAYRCDYSPEWTMRFVSVGCEELTGYPPESLLENKKLSFSELISPDYQSALLKEWARVLKDNQAFRYEYEIQTASGQRKWVLELGQGVFDESGVVKALEGIVIDISDRKQMENTLKFNNEHDNWTGLLNRYSLEQQLQEDLKKKEGGNQALISINLSEFHQLTLTYGFRYSQMLIRKVALALSGHSSDQRILYRTYENRFVFYVRTYRTQSELVDFCSLLIASLKSILSIERIGGGIGVLELKQNTISDVDEILKNLIIASEKASSKNDSNFGVCFYDSVIEQQIQREQAINKELEMMAADPDHSGLFLQFQPIIDLNSGKLVGFEALARLRSQTLGLVSPLEFIPIAERTKLIIPIGMTIFRRAFDFLIQLRAQGFETVQVSVNVSILQLIHEGFADDLLDLIREMEVNADQVGIEITESVFSADYSRINQILSTLKQAGIHLSLDDFGTGYCSLARESNLFVHTLKIDKVFIDALAKNPRKSIVNDVISMAHKFDHCTVAEGVELPEQLDLLRACGCDRIQGYLISRPLDQDAALEYSIASQQSRSDGTDIGIRR